MILPLLRSISSENIDLQESVLRLAENDYWQSTFLDESGHPICGGFGPSQEIARKIASAEFLERRFFRKISQDNSLGSTWGLDHIPTGCGFAVGFDRANTIQRSVCEAVERWVMSQWIDNKKWIERLPENSDLVELDSASAHFRDQFDDVWYFMKTVHIPLGTQVLEVKVAQTMGFKDGGIFPGSSAQTTYGSIWQHSLLESYRHLLAYRNNPKQVQSFPSNKVAFFGKNAQIAIRQIAEATDLKWDQPRIRFFNVESQDNGSYFVARTILADWESWHGGSLERFLY